MVTPIIKNLLHVVRRFRLATILNVLGLSVAFATFMVIMIHLNYHFSFGSIHQDHDKIFRIESIDHHGIQPTISRAMAEHFFESSPHIVAGGIRERSGQDALFHVDRDGQRHFYKEPSLAVSSGFFDVFSFDFIEGRKEDLGTGGGMFIPLSLSRRLFGYESAVGQVVFHSQWGYQTVRGVYRDFPTNTVVENRIFFALNPLENIQEWRRFIYTAYIRVDNASNASFLMKNFKRIFDGTAAWGDDFEWGVSENDLRLTALSDIPFLTDIGTAWNPVQKVSKPTLLILLAIGIAIIIIAAINFTNFSTALFPMRVRNINTQRVLGAQQRTIRWALIFEAIAFSFVSYLVALMLVKRLGDSSLAVLINADLSLLVNQRIIGGTALVALVTGLLAGLFPSLYMTSFAPALALKGNFGLSPKGKKIRNTLIGIQFVASLVLIIGASFMYLQSRFMFHSDFGFDRDGLIVVDISRIRNQHDAFTHQLRAHNGIADVSFTESVFKNAADRFGGSTGNTVIGEDTIYLTLNHFAVKHNFLQMMNIDILSGRGFSQEDVGGPPIAILNETARTLFGVGLGEEFWGSEIVGFIPDIHVASFRRSINPMRFTVMSGTWGMPIAYIKLRPNADRQAAMAHIRNTLTNLDPNYPFYEIRYFDDILQESYERELALSTLILIFSLIAILISIVGVFGLVVFDSECRRTEIGIRKVHGASTLEIITMFNKSYLAILLICFVIAVPIAWIAVSRWLENFAYRTPMYWWVYLVAFLAVAVITVVTVTVQNWRVANEDPVKSIKTE